ncbi:G protein-coupled glucose receptor regulating Gpa2-domain-containing protein [Apodospora peruviana]|uniref:G protein-coupled glucose receptor regulating Gpa2-domain-containing protein n=1 Tax=Apodospora peruviana TaxID=516989 RepID=A0AAE0I5X2_9PEZI|nr:G protein-coupled glucose receptor regulating Gpa2-domain-containing protein [Apodospora peruviana]
MVYVLTILSLAFASISVVSTLFTLYWFLKMRRSFRHELIMLLIQSDLIKSMAFLIFPIVNLYRGPVQSSSAFCQVSGFALAIGIESSDVAVLLIAVHSVMYIFRPKSGLYPYRRTAYMIYYLFPLTMACLAFVDGTGYQNIGHYCYLRTDNGWARLALSWVPRYVVSTSIVLIYAFVYFYVRKRMVDYGRRSSTSLPSPWPRVLRDNVPPTPPIAHHGLLASAPVSRRGSAVDSVKDRKRSSVSSISTVNLDHHSRNSSTTAAGESGGSKAVPSPMRPIQWNSEWSGFRKKPAAGPAETGPLVDDAEDPLSSPGLVFIASPPPIHSPEERRNHCQPVSEDPSDSSSIASLRVFWRRPLASSYDRRGSSMSSTASAPAAADPPASARTDAGAVQRPRKVSLSSLVSILRKGPSTHVDPVETPSSSSFDQGRHRTPSGNTHHPPDAPPPTEVAASIVLERSLADDSGVTKNREKIRRQLRSLIVYPTAYLVIWLFPFVSHVIGYDDAVQPNDPQWLLIVSIISLCIQGTVDSVLFAIREQPWRYARGRFWTAVGRYLTPVGWMSGWGSWSDQGGVAGRTREEMLVDGRLARMRREEEIAFERRMRHGMKGRSDSLAQQRLRPGEYVPQRKGAREWWDVVEVDGASVDVDDFDDEYIDDGEVSQHVG